jgi:hypothetical protein
MQNAVMSAEEFFVALGMWYNEIENDCTGLADSELSLCGS